jgi:hypothetical protein
MVVTVEGSGTQSATVTTEHVLDTVTAAGVFVLIVDTANMVAGDILELRVKKPVLAAGTERVEYFAAFYGAQITDDVLKTSVPVVQDSTAGGLLFTLKQTFGVGRSFAWKVLAIG